MYQSLKKAKKTKTTIQTKKPKKASQNSTSVFWSSFLSPLICDCFISLDSEIFRAGAMALSSHVVESLCTKCAPGSKSYLLFNCNNTSKAHRRLLSYWVRYHTKYEWERAIEFFSLGKRAWRQISFPALVEMAVLAGSYCRTRITAGLCLSLVLEKKMHQDKSGSKWGCCLIAFIARPCPQD